MLSSISSSNERLPRGPWGKVLALTLLLSASTLIGLEFAWRAAGFRPTVDYDASWVMERSRVRRQSIVAVGTSRIQAGLDLHCTLGDRCYGT